LQQRLLDQTIHDTGNTPLPGPAFGFGFGDVDGAYTLRVVLTGEQTSMFSLNSAGTVNYKY
jgi:hypothetical protein